MKANFRLMAVTLTLLSASLAGCIGGDDEGDGEYSGPINLVVFYDSTSGMVETTMNNGQAGPTTGVELSFDLQIQLQMMAQSPRSYLTPTTVHPQ